MQPASLIDIDRFGSLDKLLKTTSYVMKFVHNEKTDYSTESTECKIMVD